MEDKTKLLGIGLGLATMAVIALALMGAKPVPEGYCCPYCGVCFDTLEELQEHVRVEHPGERIPIIIDWE